MKYLSGIILILFSSALFSQSSECRGVFIDQDDFSDEVNYRTAYFNALGLSKQFVAAINESDDQQYYFLTIKAIGDEPLVGEKEVMMKFDDSEIFTWKDDVDTKVNTSGQGPAYEYFVTVSLSSDQFRKLGETKIESFKIGPVQNYPTGGKGFLKIMKCMVDKYLN